MHQFQEEGVSNGSRGQTGRASPEPSQFNHCVECVLTAVLTPLKQTGSIATSWRRLSKGVVTR